MQGMHFISVRPAIEDGTARLTPVRLSYRSTSVNYRVLHQMLTIEVTSNRSTSSKSGSNLAVSLL